MERLIFVWLNEHEARVNEVKPGWNLIDCEGDEKLKEMFLEQNLTEEDKQAWCSGEITEHCLMVIDGIGGLEENEIRIEFNRDTRQYEIEVTERIRIVLPDISHVPQLIESITSESNF
jgi:hypothetical protein